MVVGLLHITEPVQATLAAQVLAPLSGPALMSTSTAWASVWSLPAIDIAHSLCSLLKCVHPL